jgi:hypothetical protein
LHGPYLYLALYSGGRNRSLYVPAALEAVGPSLSMSGEMLTIEESVTLRARTEQCQDVGDEHE